MPTPQASVETFGVQGTPAQLRDSGAFMKSTSSSIQRREKAFDDRMAALAEERTKKEASEYTPFYSTGEPSGLSKEATDALGKIRFDLNWPDMMKPRPSPPKAPLATSQQINDFVSEDCEQCGPMYSTVARDNRKRQQKAAEEQRLEVTRQWVEEQSYSEDYGLRRPEFDQGSETKRSLEFSDSEEVD